MRRLASYTEDQLVREIELYKDKANNGMRLRDILKETNVPSSALYSTIREQEVELQGKTKVTEYPNLEKALELYADRGSNGLTVNSIASKYGIPTSRLYLEIDIRGIKPRMKGRKYTEKDVHRAVDLYINRPTNGLKVKDILAQTSVTQTALYGELNRRGIVSIDKNKEQKDLNSLMRRKGNLDKAVELFIHKDTYGLTVTKILKIAKVSTTTLYGELRKRGYKID
ncbi:transcriptional regulator [Bacillus thuringiensis]|uniref:transcriptional regulator n=1 Tax=Bacillus thuringiensis TaxID=1428 RepID=UPI0020CD5CFA|nr:transcriptional regulator [Bacillus thuringiensis]